MQIQPQTNSPVIVRCPSNANTQQELAHETDNPIIFTEDNGKFVATIEGNKVGSMTLNSRTMSDSQKELQKAIFTATYIEFKSVQENPPHHVNPDFINAQYIEALKEVVLLEDGGNITIETAEQGNHLVHEKVDGTKITQGINAGEPTDSAIKNYLQMNELYERTEPSRANDSRSLGMVIETGLSTICLGATEENASIQSVSKIFADITLGLCERNLYLDGDNKECAIFNLGNSEPVNVPSGYSSFRRGEHAIPVKDEFSEHKFNQRENLGKVRDVRSETTQYSLPNASNNYGALTTTGRIPDQAIINNELIKGRDNIVKVLIEGILGYSISINEPVLEGELKDTYKDRAVFLETYTKKYLPEKQKIVDESQASGSSWLTRKEALEAAKPALPDNLTRVYWLAEKGAFGEDLRDLAKTLKHDPRLEAGYSPETLEKLRSASDFFEGVMRSYTTHCAFNVTCEDLARLAYVIASGGRDALGNQIIDPDIAKEAIAQMEAGGLYDQSNQIEGIKDTPFNAVKSGVGGFLMNAVHKEKSIVYLTSHPNDAGGFYSRQDAEDIYNKLFGGNGLSMSTIARPLNEAGNSASGLLLIEKVGNALTKLALQHNAMA